MEITLCERPPRSNPESASPPPRLPRLPPPSQLVPREEVGSGPIRPAPLGQGWCRRGWQAAGHSPFLPTAQNVMQQIAPRCEVSFQGVPTRKSTWSPEM